MAMVGPKDGLPATVQGKDGCQLCRHARAWYLAPFWRCLCMTCSDRRPQDLPPADLSCPGPVLPLAWPYQSHDWRHVGSRPSTSPVTRRSARPRSVENSRCLRRVFGALVRCRLGLRHRRLRLQSVFLHALWRGRLPLGGLCDARRGRGLRWRRRNEGRGSWAD